MLARAGGMAVGRSFRTPFLSGELTCIGSLDVDWSSGRWKYHREERDGPIDSDVMRQRFPERYVWSCCGTAGDVRNSGCRSGHHAEPGYSEKRVCQSGESMPMEMEM